jgi:5'-deoxynucleotidase YfbR-like HD superfamily hydrolase
VEHNQEARLDTLRGEALKEILQFISEGGSVVRYHTRPGMKLDTDASHSFGVAMLCSLLAGRDEATNLTRASVNLLMAALTHDLAEQKAGDMSAPAKRALGIRDLLQEFESDELKVYWLDYAQHLTEDESVILQMADCFDGMLYCCRELALGNRNALLIWRRYCTYVTSITASSTLPLEIALRASVMFESIKEIYHETLSPEGPSFDVFAGSKQ